jgi:flagellar export protein FliJ
LKPFRFRLQSVLQYSARKLDLAQFARASAQSHVQAVSRELSALRDARSKLQSTPPPHARLSALLLQQASVRGDWIQRHEARVQDRLSEASRALQERERQLRQARRELKKFELLRDRRRRDWTRNEERLEQKRLDEVGSRVRHAAAKIAATGGKADPPGFRATL